MFPIVFLWFLGGRWAESAESVLKNIRKNTEKSDDVTIQPSEGFLAVPATRSVSSQSNEHELHPPPNLLKAESTSSEGGYDIHASSNTQPNSSQRPRDVDSSSTDSAGTSKPKSRSSGKFKAAVIRGLIALTKPIEKPENKTSDGVPEPQPVLLSPSDDSLLGSSISISKEELAKDAALENVTWVEPHPIDVTIRSPSADSLTESPGVSSDELEDRLDKVLFLLNEVRNSLKQVKEFLQIVEEAGKTLIKEKEVMERQLEEQERLISEFKIRIEEHDRKIEKLYSNRT